MIKCRIIHRNRWNRIRRAELFAVHCKIPVINTVKFRLSQNTVEKETCHMLRPEFVKFSIRPEIVKEFILRIVDIVRRNLRNEA